MMNVFMYTQVNCYGLWIVLEANRQLNDAEVRLSRSNLPR